ncbi:hypothetical protein OCE55_21120 [Bacillus paranthracis]|uniref:hypothetical protein n=1 Tax=Bacillus cereus group TaxID=86661 RepID=UPI00062D9ECE|nr:MULTISPECIES: hypothetical protein [Bacillus cereus group]KLA04015.1 hypothetical protein B4153_5880 [Bacillus cereus]MCU5390523.1 hypothetical protein [Bacillus paranthracis]
MNQLSAYKEMLKKEANELRYRVVFSGGAKSNKACHDPYYVIFINRKEDGLDTQTIYSFAHEIGHCIDFRNGMLDFQEYKRNKKYRIRKEIIAWYLGYKLLRKLEIPVDGYIKHAAKCLGSYFN